MNRPNLEQMVAKSTTKYNERSEARQAPTSNSTKVTLANGFSMDQNTPNPFNKETNISFVLPEASMASLMLTDVMGKNYHGSESTLQ